MDQSTKDILVQAVQLLKEGNGQAAVPLLAQVLKKEPELEQGWYLLGMALDDDAKKRRAFKQVLKINPDNEKAIHQLELLEPAPAPPPPTEPEPRTEESSAFFTPEESPFSEEPDSVPFPTEDFELPDWMQESSFNPADYTTSGLDEDVANRLAPQEDDTPDWAKRLNPWENPVLPDEADEEPASPEEEAFPTTDWEEAFSEEPTQNDQPEWAALPSGQYDDSGDDFGYGQPFEEGPDESWDEPFVSEQEETAQRISAFFDEEDEGEDDPQTEKDSEWLRGMVPDEKESRKKVARVRLTPDQKRRRWRIVRNFLLILVIGGLGYVGYLFRDQIKTTVEPYWAQVEPYFEPVQTFVAPVSMMLTEKAPITALLTPDYFVTPSPTAEPPSQPTAEPTWTPQGGSGALPPDGGSSLQPNQTPVSTPVFSQLTEEELAVAATIEEDVSSVRTQAGPAQLERELVSESGLYQAMSNYLLTEENLAQLAVDQIVLQAFGFINGDTDLTRGFISSKADPVGGYFDQDEGIIYVVGSEFGPGQQYIYAHEYAHAIQDVNFGLQKLGIYPNCEKSFQACLASQAIVEGEATLVENLWYALHPPAGNLNEFLDQIPSVRFDDGTIPAYYRMNAQFPFEQGLEFVRSIYEEGGWKAVNRLYGYLPATTEQILHPEKYQRGEEGADMSHPDLTLVLKDGWELVRDESLGEWETFLLLAYNDYPDASLPVGAAEAAAAGWAGDEYQVYYNADTGKTFLSAYWLWETDDDANDFYNRLTSYVNVRLFSSEVDGPGDGICWFHNQQMSCIYRSGRFILWLHTDEITLIEQVLPRFTKFD